MAAWRDSLSAEEVEAWDDYASISHHEINEALRGAPEGGDPLAGLDEDQVRTVRGMDSALERAPRSPEPRTLYRGIQLSRGWAGTQVGTDALEWVSRHAQVGQTMTFHGFTSTSKDPGQAEYFSGANGDFSKSGVIFEITTSQGGEWGGDGPEQEVTLPRGSSFTVTAVDGDHQLNGKPYPKVHLAEVEAGTPANDGPPSH